MKLLFSSVVICILPLLVVGDTSCIPVYNGVPNPAPAPDPVAPDNFRVQFDVDIAASDPIIMEVTRAWSPRGVDRFYALVKDGFYNCAAFFRVVPDFVVQYGIAAIPEETAKWDTAIEDDPVVQSNLQWTVSFATAGPDTRTTQLFINYVDNVQLDASGFSPFAMVTSGFDTALAITNPTPDDSNGVNQYLYTKHGNEWLLKAYPNVTLISSVSIV